MSGDGDGNGLERLKAKLDFPRLYEGVEAEETARSFFQGAEVFDRLVDHVRPRLIIEVGTWMGHSAIHMSRRAAALSGEALTICVDTWLGSVEHYFNDDHLADLALDHGRPGFYGKFLANIVAHGLCDRVLPLSAPSHTGYEILAQLDVRADLIYIDAGHGYDDVRRDVRDYAKLLGPKGVIFGDDFFYPPVRRAVTHYAAAQGWHVASAGERGHKWMLVRSREEAAALLGDVAMVEFI